MEVGELSYARPKVTHTRCRQRGLPPAKRVVMRVRRDRSWFRLGCLRWLASSTARDEDAICGDAEHERRPCHAAEPHPTTILPPVRELISGRVPDAVHGLRGARRPRLDAMPGRARTAWSAQSWAN